MNSSTSFITRVSACLLLFKVVLTTKCLQALLQSSYFSMQQQIKYELLDLVHRMSFCILLFKVVLTMKFLQALLQSYFMEQQIKYELLDLVHSLITCLLLYISKSYRLRSFCRHSFNHPLPLCSNKQSINCLLTSFQSRIDYEAFGSITPILFHVATNKV